MGLKDHQLGKIVSVETVRHTLIREDNIEIITERDKELSAVINSRLTKMFERKNVFIGVMSGISNQHFENFTTENDWPTAYLEDEHDD